jgi:polyhydroxybutyrate depolymerase
MFTTVKHARSRGIVTARCLFASFVLAISSARDEASAAPRAGEFEAETVAVGDTRRTYRLVVPETVDLSKPAPLVVAFHGIGIDSKDFMPKYSRLGATAANEKFLLVFPQAVDGAWGLAPRKVDADLTFFDALVDQISERYRVDERRIFALGMSNGGYFAHIVGRERANRVAAIASHSGPLGLETLAGVRAPRKFPVMILHGDRDRLFPVEFARENRDKYRREGHFVEYVELAGVGHTWGSQQGVNDRIWTFFKKHPLPKKPPANARPKPGD